MGADCKERKIATQGWLETSTIDVVDFIQDYERFGVLSTICTDVAKDGMLAGSAVTLYEEILSKCNVQLIASGGVALTHLEVLLQHAGGTLVRERTTEGSDWVSHERLHGPAPIWSVG